MTARKRGRGAGRDRQRKAPRQGRKRRAGTSRSTRLRGERGGKVRRSSVATRKRSPVREPKARRATGRRGGSRVSEVERAVKVIGEERIKPGPVKVAESRAVPLRDERGRFKRRAGRVGGTRRLTPTKAGFRAFHDVATEISRTQRMRKRPAIYTATLKIRLRGPDGRFQNIPPLEGIGLPLPSQVQAGRQPGETEAETFSRLIDQNIRAAVFRQVDLLLGDYRETKAGKRWERARMRGDWKAARSALARIKAERSVTYRVDFNRQLTGESDATEGIEE